MKWVGWLGTQLLAWCALPQVVETLERGTAEGVSPWFLFMWGLGEILTLWYVYVTIGKNWPLLVNYIINLTCIGVILWVYMRT